MKSLIEVLKMGADFLDKKGVKGSLRQAQELIADCLGMNRIELYMLYDRPLTHEEYVHIQIRLERRANKEPLQYINGKVSFYGCILEVNPSVLIPRQETEILVDKIAAEVKEGVVWDIGTGSGAIGLALKKKHPALKVVLSDISQEALAVASRNAEMNGLKVDLRQGDLFTPFKGEQADVIISNPPYISEEDYHGLEPEVKNFEPPLALIGGPTGYEFYERLSDGLPLFLKEGGRAFFEIGKDQGNRIKALFSQDPYVLAKVEPDWSGCDRFFSLKINQSSYILIT